MHLCFSVIIHKMGPVVIPNAWSLRWLNEIISINCLAQRLIQDMGTGARATFVVAAVAFTQKGTIIIRHIHHSTTGGKQVAHGGSQSISGTNRSVASPHVAVPLPAVAFVTWGGQPLRNYECGVVWGSKKANQKIIGAGRCLFLFHSFFNKCSASCHACSRSVAVRTS